jgi:hypothetical protein
MMRGTKKDILQDCRVLDGCANDCTTRVDTKVSNSPGYFRA